jgi:hypothetical protein
VGVGDDMEPAAGCKPSARLRRRWPGHRVGICGDTKGAEGILALVLNRIDWFILLYTKIVCAKL